MKHFRTSLLLSLFGLCGSACLGPAPTSAPGDPTVLLRSSAGDELGVATDHGVLFLNRGGQRGWIDLTAWFSDGASWEEGRVQPLGGGLFATQPEIRLATAALSFDEPGRGDAVLVRGRRGYASWETTTEVATHPSVDGLLLRLNDRLRRMDDTEIGAGVYVGPDADQRLIGLVSGRLLLETSEGEREYLTVVGTRDLWRAVLRERERGDRAPFVYREDIL